MAADKARQAVRGICPHGKVLFLCANDPQTMKQCRKDIADMVAHGFTIDTVSVEVARQAEMECSICHGGV